MVGALIASISLKDTRIFHFPLLLLCTVALERLCWQFACFIPIFVVAAVDVLGILHGFVSIHERLYGHE